MLMKHGLRNTREYKQWVGVKRRCNDSNLKIYKNYGAKGSMRKVEERLKVIREYRKKCKPKK